MIPRRRTFSSPKAPAILQFERFSLLESGSSNSRVIFLPLHGTYDLPVAEVIVRHIQPRVPPNVSNLKVSFKAFHPDSFHMYFKFLTLAHRDNHNEKLELSSKKSLTDQRLYFLLRPCEELLAFGFVCKPCGRGLKFGVLNSSHYWFRILIPLSLLHLIGSEYRFIWLTHN